MEISMSVSARAGTPVDRASPADLMQLATDVGPAPMNIGAVLVLGPAPRFTVTAAERLLAGRIEAVPRLRQRLHRAPPGCGRPYWADDADFDVRQHVRCRDCPKPGDQTALLEVAATVVTEPLPWSRPLWAATFVTGLADGSTGLILVMNHVVADGVGGLAVLAGLGDEVAGSVPAVRPAASFPAPAPSVRTLAADAWAGRVRRLRHPTSLRWMVRQGIAELGGAGQSQRTPLTSLNRPVGPRRRYDVVAADLGAIRDFGHAHGGTVSDVLAAAAVGAVHALLASRGERLDLVTLSMPVSARLVTSAGLLGNQVGVMPVTLSAAGDLTARLPQVAAITRERKQAARGTSAVLLGPVFRLLAPTGLLRWLIERQRLIHAFATYLHGPAEQVSFGGAPVTAVIPLIGVTGNVPVSFVALSYAGTLRITVVSDPDRVPDVGVVAAALRRDLGEASR
jgi:diacylglycerol O-acyltransferase / wax synthase